MVGHDERRGSSLKVVALPAAPLACSSHLPSTLTTNHLQDCNFAPSDRERHRRGYCPLSPLSNTPEQVNLEDGGNAMVTMMIVLLNNFWAP